MLKVLAIKAWREEDSKAHLKCGIELNIGNGVSKIGTGSIIFQQEAWESCVHVRPV